MWKDMKRNAREIREAMKIPMIYRTIGFFVMSAAVVPSYGEIQYFFNLNVVKFSKFTVSMLTIVSYVAILVGVIIFGRYFKQREMRQLLTWSLLIQAMGTFATLIFVLRLNVNYLGINDTLFIIFINAFTETTHFAFGQLPTLILIAKITPSHVEATVFAVLTGTFNLCNNFISPNVGVFINQAFVGVTT
jgi:hypothetical protein